LEHLYDRIRDARERAGLSVNEAAERLGVSRVQIWRMENKTETISAERLFMIAALYQVDPYELFRGSQATTRSVNAMYRQIGEVVAMVEAEVQRLDAKPDPEIVGEAVIEILRQEAREQNNRDPQPLNIEKYQGLIALIFKQTKQS
jgi:transcriptional regulator with XRE-family HTH domain